MKDLEKDWHDKLYQEDLGARRSVMPFYEVARRARQRFFELLFQQVSSAISILDYGCGTGDCAIFLAERGAKVVGIDISSEAIKQAKEKAKQKGLDNLLMFEQMDAENLQYADNSFDFVYGVSILHHLQLSSAYHEIARVLKPSGRALFLEPLGHNPIINYFRAKTPHLVHRMSILLKETIYN